MNKNQAIAKVVTIQAHVGAGGQVKGVTRLHSVGTVVTLHRKTLKWWLNYPMFPTGEHDVVWVKPSNHLQQDIKPLLFLLDGDRLRCTWTKGQQLGTYLLKLVSSQNPWFLLILVVPLKTKENWACSHRAWDLWVSWSFSRSPSVFSDSLLDLREKKRLNKQALED